MAAASGDGEAETLLSTFDQIYDDFERGAAEIQSLRLSCDAEVKRREALEIACDGLRRDNERLTKLYSSCMNNLADQLESRTKCQRLEEEIKRLIDEHQCKANEQIGSIELLQQDYTTKVEELEAQIRGFQTEKASHETTIYQLRHELTTHKIHIQALASRLEQLHFDLDLKYQLEIQDLKDCLLLEQEEKKDLIKKLHNLEKELLITRTKFAQEQRDSATNRQVETLKQKVMNLRRENEILKRKLPASEEG
ncbi:protein At-4/1 isoform X2 [Eucalyptus grandis]|uniref:protein At-4/1 isoform X2 n=1 Tax=Eucalyptus grandis TaxID=71139 RepID=UPI000527BFF4|nr:protein At-4/1 isoform X2 [Eucalyptus grandis]